MGSDVTGSYDHAIWTDFELSSFARLLEKQFVPPGLLFFSYRQILGQKARSLVGGGTTTVVQHGDAEASFACRKKMSVIVVTPVEYALLN